MSSRLPGQRYWGLVYRSRAYFFFRGSRRVFPIRFRPVQDTPGVFPCTRGGRWIEVEAGKQHQLSVPEQLADQCAGARPSASR